MVKRKEKTRTNREDNRGSPRRRNKRIDNVRGVVRQGVNPVRGMGGLQPRAKSGPTRKTLVHIPQGRTPGTDGREAEAVATGVVVMAVTVAADAATGVKREKNKGVSMAEQPGQLLGK